MTEDASGKHRHPRRELPSSFDATELICRVEDLEGGGNGTMVDLRLLELDSITRSSQSISNRPSDTALRLFLAVAHGKHFASVQLYTLELGLSDDLDKPMSDMEWVELSQQRSTNLEEDDGGTSLAFQIGSKDTMITACALVPAPTVTKFEYATKDSEVASGRCVALLFGTNDNRVFSVTLRVASVSTGGVDGVSLEFDCCRMIRNGRIHSPSGEEGKGRLSIRQILPSADVRTDDAIEDVNEGIGAHAADHIELYYPTIPRDSTAGQYSGIESISCSRCDKSSYSNPGKDRQIVLARDSIFVTYKNGTIVRLPSWAAFLSHGEKYDIANETEGIANDSIVIPYESMYRHLLDEPPQKDNHTKNLTKCVSTMVGEENDYWSLLARAIRGSQGEFSCNSWPVDALVIPDQSTGPTLPIDFNTSKIYHEFTTSSEDMLLNDASDDEDSDEYGSRASTSDDENFGTTGAVVAGTAALVRGAVGVVRWGLGASDAIGSSPVEDAKEDDSMDAEEPSGTRFDGHKESMSPSSDGFGRGKQMHSWQQSASMVFCDHPRQFEKAIVDPTGTRAALIDNIGRIVLYNLDTKQILLILKGIRKAKIHFSELHHIDNCLKGGRLFLVVHLIQAQRIDVYRLSDGSRVHALAVPSKDNCRLIECQGPPSQGSLLSCFLLDRIAIDEKSSQYFVDKICIDDEVKADNRRVVEADKSSERELFYLLQLLSDGHDVNFTPQTILSTFKMLTLSDVGEGLDALSQCSRVECNSLELQTKALAHCELLLEEARLKESLQGSGQSKKMTINSLAKKVKYHESVLRAYHVLHQYETRRSGTNEAETDLDHGGAAANHW